MIAFAVAVMIAVIILVGAAAMSSRLPFGFGAAIVVIASVPAVVIVVSDSPNAPSFDAEPQPSHPDESAPSEPGSRLVESLADSIVSITAHGCEQIASGTGFVVAADLIATSAHVVAAADTVAVTTRGGEELVGEIVAFDPDLDAGVVQVRDLAAPPLLLNDPVPGSQVFVVGYPEGADLRTAKALVKERIVALGRDIYGDSEVRRDVVVLAARLDPGESGSPVVNSAGEVVAMAFAVDAGDPETAYALVSTAVGDMSETQPVGPQETGPCLDV